MGKGGRSSEPRRTYSGSREIVRREAHSGERQRRLTTSRETGTWPDTTFSHKHNTVAPFQIPLLCSLMKRRKATKGVGVDTGAGRLLTPTSTPTFTATSTPTSSQHQPEALLMHRREEERKLLRVQRCFCYPPGTDDSPTGGIFAFGSSVS